MAFLIIDSTIFTPGFYIVNEEIFNQIKALPFSNEHSSRQAYNKYLNDIQLILDSDDDIEYHCLDTYSNLSIDAVEGVFAINGG